MIIVTGIAEVAESDIAEIKTAAAKMAKASRSEAGCVNYAFYEDIETPGRFRIYEEWEDADALRAHFNTKHMSEFNLALKSVNLLSLSISQFMRGEDVKVNA